MAKNAAPAKKSESVSKCVHHPPPNYRYKDGVGKGSDNSCLPLIEIPVIDIGLLASPSTCTQELGKLHSALTSYGGFWSINHGITSSFLDKFRSNIKQFFALPMEEKQKYARDVGSTEGFGKDDPGGADHPVIRPNYRLTLTLTPENQRQLKFWPENPPSFRETLLEYITKLQLITEVILKAMAMSLNLEEHCFLDKYGVQANLRARFNLYPPYSGHLLDFGLGAHADPSAITILLQDEVEGLQILKDDQWFSVPIIPDALFINTGEQVEIMSNGLFKSLVHRAVTNPDRERMSLAVFCNPDANSDIEPVDGLVNETRPKLFKKEKNYFYAAMQHGKQNRKKLLDALKI